MLKILKMIGWCPEAELNHRHKDFQSFALPLSYLGMAGATRLELATSGVTGQRSDQLNYAPYLIDIITY